MRSPKFLGKNLLFDTFKRMRPMTVLFSIVLCLGMPVACLLAFSGLNGPEFEGEYLINASDAIAHILGREYVLLSAAFGVFAGCTVMRRYMKRQSAVLFASIPVRREKLFLVNYTSGWFSYLLATLISVLLTCGVFTIYGVIGQTGGLFSCLGAGFIWFFFAYSLTAFAGSLCGLTSIQFLFVCGILAYLPATVALTSFLVDDVFFEYINVNYYLSADIMEYLSPVVRLFVNVAESFIEDTGAEGLRYLYSGALWYALAALAFCVLTVLVLRVRKHEKAGAPIVFNLLNSVVKYAVMLPCTLLTGIIFYVTDSLIFMIVGFAIGAVLSFMLMNVILAKNPRAYFTGIKGLGIFAVCFAACFTLLVVDPMGVDEYIPSPDAVKSASIYLNGTEMEFTDKEDIEAINALMDAAQSDDSEFDFKYMGTYSSGRSMSVNVVYRMNAGVDFAKSAFLSDTSAAYEALNHLLTSQKYREMVFFEAEEYLDNEYIEGVTVEFMVISDGYQVWDGAYISKREAQRILEIIKECETPIVSSELGPQVATLRAGYQSGGIPIYYHHSDEIHSMLSDAHFEYPAMKIDRYLSGCTAVRLGTGEEYTDAAKIKELYLRSAGFDPGYILADSFSTENEATFFFGGCQVTTYLYD